MGDATVPERRDGRHALPTGAAVQAGAEAPGMPVIRLAEQTETPYPLLDGVSPTIGWQFRPQSRDGPAFVIIRRTGFGSLKAVESFPLTEDGWASAWQHLAALNPAAVPKALAALRHRSAEAARLSAGSRELQELDALSLASLREVAYLGGYVPGAGIFAGERYDARFLEDRLVVVPCRQAGVLAEVPYSEVEDVDIGGPGLVRTGGGFAGGGFGATGAVEGMAIAAVLNGLTTRTSIKTIVRIQGTGCELFLLHTKATPEQLRIELSRPLGAIRSARTSSAVGRNQHPAAATSASPVEELTRLAAMLEKDLLTREEFDQIKAKLLGHQT